MVTNILNYLDDKALRFPEKTAIADDKRSLSFKLWKEEAERIGTRIAIDTKGTKRHAVMVFVDRRIETLVGFMGVVNA